MTGTQYRPPSVSLDDTAVEALAGYFDRQARVRAAHHVGFALPDGTADDFVVVELNGRQPVGSRRMARFVGLDGELPTATRSDRPFTFLSQRLLKHARPVATELWHERGSTPGLDPLDFEYRWAPYPIADELKASVARDAAAFDGPALSIGGTVLDKAIEAGSTVLFRCSRRGAHA